MRELSDQQMRLLRLVFTGTTTSKALANETGLQPRSIDTYLQAAAKALGCENRILAARRFAEIERESSQSPSQLRTTRLVAGLVSAIFAIANVARSFAFGLPLGGARHGFGWRRIALEILRVGVIGMAGVFALVLVVIGFLRTFG
jgi:DNA-binding CsgD family transcriptional regulator